MCPPPMRSMVIPRGHCGWINPLRQLDPHASFLSCYVVSSSFPRAHRISHQMTPTQIMAKYQSTPPRPPRSDSAFLLSSLSLVPPLYSTLIDQFLAHFPLSKRVIALVNPPRSFVLETTTDKGAEIASSGRASATADLVFCTTNLSTFYL